MVPDLVRTIEVPCLDRRYKQEEDDDKNRNDWGEGDGRIWSHRGTCLSSSSLPNLEDNIMSESQTILHYLQTLQRNSHSLSKLVILRFPIPLISFLFCVFQDSLGFQVICVCIYSDNWAYITIYKWEKFNNINKCWWSSIIIVAMWRVGWWNYDHRGCDQDMHYIILAGWGLMDWIRFLKRLYASWSPIQRLFQDQNLNTGKRFNLICKSFQFQ